MSAIGKSGDHPFIELRVRLEDWVTAERVRVVFGAIPELRPNGPSHWLWLDEPSADGAPADQAVDEPSVLGTIALDAPHLDVRLRSGPSTAQAQAVLAPVLLALAGPPLQLGIVRRWPPPQDLPAPSRPAATAPVRVEPILMRGDAADGTDHAPTDGDRMVACLVVPREETSPKSCGGTGGRAPHWLWSIARAATRR